MPQVTLDTSDAAELAQTLAFLAGSCDLWWPEGSGDACR